MTSYDPHRSILPPTPSQFNASFEFDADINAVCFYEHLGLCLPEHSTSKPSEQELQYCIDKFRERMNPCQNIGACACCGARGVHVKTHLVPIGSLNILLSERPLESHNQEFWHLVEFKDKTYHLAPQFIQLEHGQAWICESCNKFIRSHNLPPFSFKLCDCGRIPAALNLPDLSVAEKLAIAPRITFCTTFKITERGTGLRSKFSGHIVSIPSDSISKITTELPRCDINNYMHVTFIGRANAFHFAMNVSNKNVQTSHDSNALLTFFYV